MNRSKLKKVWKGLFFLLFLGIITIPMIGVFQKGQVSQEKRELNELPELKLDESIEDYPEDFEAFFNDRFLFRNSMITANNYFYLQASATSGVPEKVAVGKNNWLFYTGGGAVEYTHALDPFEEEELEKIVSDLEKREQILEDQGIEYYFMVAPNKHAIYSEQLPEFMKQKGEQTRYEQLLAKFEESDSDFEIIDLHETLLETKKEKPVFFKFNTHWNHVGAFTAYQTTINEIQEDFPEIEPLTLEDYNSKYAVNEKADLKAMLSLNDLIFESSEQLMLKNKKSTRENIEGSEYFQLYIFRTNDPSKPNAILLGDSFTDFGYAAAMAENFNTMVVIREGLKFYPITQEMINEYEPDLIIQEMVERKLQTIDMDVLGEVEPAE